MPAVPVGLRGTLYDLANKRQFEVFIDGDLSRSDRQIGGGPMPPGEGDGGWTGDPGYGKPPPTWGGGGQPYPPGGGGGGWGPAPPGTHPMPPIYMPPGFWGPNDPRPGVGPIIPPENVPPGMQPPETPPPGTTTPVPPPEGSGGWPVQPITAPAYVVFNYPGYGPLYVTPPAAPAAPTPTGRRG